MSPQMRSSSSIASCGSTLEPLQIQLLLGEVWGFESGYFNVASKIKVGNINM